MFAAREHRRNTTRGQIYNLGGGPARTTSVLELLRGIEAPHWQAPLDLHRKEVRPGDQPLYISDTAKMERDTGWRGLPLALSEILTDIRRSSTWRPQCQAIRESATTRDAPRLELLTEEVA